MLCVPHLYYSHLSGEPDPEKCAEYQNHVQWLGRGGQPLEIGAAALFLPASRQAFSPALQLPVTGVGEAPRYLRMPWNQ